MGIVSARDVLFVYWMYLWLNPVSQEDVEELQLFFCCKCLCSGCLLQLLYIVLYCMWADLCHTVVC